LIGVRLVHTRKPTVTPAPWLQPAE
jgi:hypothetical protein